MAKISRSAKIKGRIVELGLSQAIVAEMISMSVSRFNEKLNDKGYFTRPEIVKLCDVLDIPKESIVDYFFN